MSKEQVRAILDRVLTWPEQRQEDAAKVLMLMEATDESVYRLTDEQAAQVGSPTPTASCCPTPKPVSAFCDVARR